MRTILWTGFEPWGTVASNPSWDWIADWEPVLPPGWRLLRLSLPVSWSRAWPKLETALETHTRDLAVVVCGGVAVKRDKFTPERFARNFANLQSPDVDGAFPPSHPIDPTGPEVREASLPIDTLVTALQRAGLPAEASTDAGDYLCNHLSYRLLTWTHRHPEAASIKAGFFHVPPRQTLPETQWEAARDIVLRALIDLL
jgi:pyroglutamyl-peptidase